MELPTHPLLVLVERNANCLKSMLTHYIDATVDSQFASIKDSILLMIQSGQIGPQPSHNVTAFGTTSPPLTQANTDQSSAQCLHEYSNDTLTRALEHQNIQQNHVPLAKTINTDNQMIKREFNEDEEREMNEEEINDDNVDMNCVKSEKGICTSWDDTEMGENGDEYSDKTRHNAHAAFENNRATQLIISNYILPSPSPTNPINIEPLIKQECLQGSSITSIPLDFIRNTALNDISMDVPIGGQNTQIQTNEFDYNSDYNDDYNCDENEYLTNSNCDDCANGVCGLDHENGNNHLNNVAAGGGDETDFESNLVESQLQIDIDVTNSTQIDNQNDEQNVINEISVSELNMEQSTGSTSGVRSLAHKRIQKKIFGDAQLNLNPRYSGKRKSHHTEDHDDECNDTEEVKGQINSDESILIQQEERDANNAIGEESIATEQTTNPIQANLAQPNRHLQCLHCHKSFVCNSKLQTHLRVHTGERPFQCNLCDKRFNQISNLTKHQLIHQNTKNFQCPQCEKQFTQKHHLDSHLRIHSEVRPFPCRHCAKSYTTLLGLTNHEQAIHLHVKPYRCKQCAHTFSQLSHIITHIRVVHFGLPRSIKEQRALNIIDERDAGELVEKV